MKKEISYGIFPLRIKNKEWEILLVQHHAGHWALPKGHEESGETPKQTAERELEEETGLSVERYLSPTPIYENYIFTLRKELISKKVGYFIALVKGHVHIQEKEIKNALWISLKDSIDQITFKEGKRMCFELCEFVKSFDDQGNPLLT